ncbi:cell envelope integrity protein TolA [Photobacterium kishitanii]
MFSGLEAENAQRGGARGKHIADEADRYGAIYKQMIQQKLLVDQSFKGQKCDLILRLSVNGLVLKVSQVSGNDTLCRAAKSAVLQVSEFPMPDNPDVVKKLQEINLTVSP